MPSGWREVGLRHGVPGGFGYDVDVLSHQQVLGRWPFMPFIYSSIQIFV